MIFSKRRKKYFVHVGFQLRFARFVILFAFISSVITGLTIFYTSFLLLGEKLMQVYPQARVVEIFRSVHIALLLDLIFIFPFLFIGSIIFSHRIAGPLPKIYQGLREIGQGNFNVKLVLRKNDELKDLATAINEMAENLKTRQCEKK